MPALNTASPAARIHKEDSETQILVLADQLPRTHLSDMPTAPDVAVSMTLCGHLAQIRLLAPMATEGGTSKA